MAITFASLIPNGDDLLQLEVEELAGVLLMVLNSYPEPDRIAFQRQSNLHRSGLCKALSNNPQYPGLQNEINKALMEAWSWLQSESFLIVDPYASDWFFVSRSGKRLKSRDDLDSYRKANLLPKGQLHPVIASRVYPAFLRGDYETAIFQAFKEVEICVRRAGQFLPEMSGIDLMRRAFSPSNGPLTDMGLPAGERDAMGHLFAGAFGVYRNSTAHRNVPTNPEEAVEVIMFASQLLRIVDRLNPQTAEATS